MENARQPGLESLPGTCLRIGVVTEFAVIPMQIIAGKCDLPGPVAVCLQRENLRQLPGQDRVFDQHALLAVQPGGAWVEVVTADKADAPVSRQCLGMQAGPGRSPDA